jgi:hemerythrin superfamily protein
MYDAHLYKWHQTRDTDEAFEWIVRDFTALKRFYKDVVDHSEAVLIVTD